MSRTLVISDLHIGSRARCSVLERPQPLERLLAEVETSDRLVLLGDVVELMEGRAHQALGVAAPILRSIGARMGRGGEVLLVPGNHDRPLIRGWLRRHLDSLAAESEVPVQASPALADVVGWLGPGRVRIRYPGVRLEDRVWATHGHYLDRHLIPVSNWGRLRGQRGHTPEDQAMPRDYERPRRVELRPAVRWLPQPLAGALHDLGELARATTMPALHDGVLDPRIAPLTSRMLSLQMRRHAIPAMARVVHRLGVDADWVLFGHVHRLGPLPHDDPAQWRGPDGNLSLLNSGSWLYEPRLVNRAHPPHPYWPGGAVVLDDGAPPRTIGLLDELPAEALV